MLVKALQHQVNKNREPINFMEKLKEYDLLMSEKYPSEQEYTNSERRLRDLKENCFNYRLARNSKVLIYTTMHIFTMIVILVMALCRRSFVSLVYVIALVPCLFSSEAVLY